MTGYLHDVEYWTDAIEAWDFLNKKARDAVEINWPRAVKMLAGNYIARLREECNRVGIPTEIALALAGRESNHGTSLDGQGWGDNHNGFGVLQVDRRYHRVAGLSSPWSVAHIRQALKIFRDALDEVIYEHSDWEPRYLLQGACVAYNSGPDNVVTIERMDVGTTHGDYGSDVMARAKLYHHKMLGWKQEVSEGLRPSDEDELNNLIIAARSQITALETTLHQFCQALDELLGSS